MIDELINDIKKWAEKDWRIDGVILVGSYANETFNDTSDIDFCVITTNKAAMIENQNFVQLFGNVVKKQTERYGACDSIRVWYDDGREVEFGIVDRSWLNLPLDAGARKVLSDGFKVVVDKKHFFRDFDCCGAL